MSDSLLTDDFKTTPYWWEDTPPPELSLFGDTNTELPPKTDVVIIGAGYTGLSAALQTARAGRHTVVVDAENAGAGCSTRNGGQISTSIKPTHKALAAKYGPERAFNILKEGHNALEWLEDFVSTESIDCHFKVVGKFLGAHNRVQYEKLGKKLSASVKGLETKAFLVPRSEQHHELGTDRYFGGIVYPNVASVDPARLHHGLLERVIAAGVIIIPFNPALDITKEGDGFRVTTKKGAIWAKEVIVASNGYTGSATPWLRRRIIPIGSYIIGTEPLAAGQMDQLIPKDRMVGDTRRMVFYYRASPDRQRILFGGRVSHAETNPLVSGPKLHSRMVDIFPELAKTRISHSWVGFVGYTFDSLAHLGKNDGVHYAMGYCGSGVSMSCYLGMRIAQQLLGQQEGRTGFDGLNFQTRPMYTGTPWFLSASIQYYRWLDSLNI
ncbi:MAG: glycine/D-amino acid oxidase-like deaminating enzyme [Gammaproteobacteria bacterium]|jgi:glycine/D-amino acid oxidase-like deaminating enzyme